MESVEYEEARGTARLIEENSSDLTDKDYKETAVSIYIIH